MKLFKKFLWILIGLVGLISIAVLLFVQHLKPEYEGEVEMADLSAKVEVYYDTYGIPHIYAQNTADAYKALGYVHAQDRLWQMELLRRIGTGGLSEVFGKDLLETDKFFLAMGIEEATHKTVKNLDPKSDEVRLAQAYLSGINQFIADGPTPIEFYLTGIDKKAFAMEDILNVMGYMSFSFAMAHKTDPWVSRLNDKLGPKYLKDLGLDVDPNTQLIPNFPNRAQRDSLSLHTDSIATNAMAQVLEPLEALSIPLFEGSNSWVIGPQKTATGKVIFANDPHIGFAQPSVWFEAHINTPDYEMYGYHLAGMPFPLLGHNRQMAYGLTMFENDDIDFYYETANAEGTQYKTPDGWRDFSTHEREIIVKDSGLVKFSYKETLHGPILNGIANQVQGDRPIAMKWIYTQEDNQLLSAVFGMTQAQNLKDFKTSVSKIHAPGLNVMYGDVDNNIAWTAAGKLYEMPKGVQTKMVLDGSSGEDEPLRFLDFSENPQSVNPPWGYVYSANNQPDTISGIWYPGYYLPENRGKRIVQLLEAKNDWDRENVETMINDVTSSMTPTVVKEIFKCINIKELSDDHSDKLDILGQWDGNYQLDRIEPTIYHRWEYFFLKNTFEDEMGPEMFKEFLATHLHKRITVPMISDEGGKSIWWDNVKTTDTIEWKSTIVTQSFQQAMEALEKELGQDREQWTWNRVHTLEHGHPIGQVESLRSFFNVGPFPIVGTREVINNLAFKYDGSGDYKVGSGPSTRRVIDFSDIENSRSILPTGQSGNPFSTHYKDQAELYNAGKFRKMLLNTEEIQSKTSTVLRFSKAE
ncbi:penicillin acylase family protein [Sediminicola luteus]|uniref:Penicillin acylase family protein n=1 Tax=Sediminicola luteus TaxID=319238 RepID=A0A2A4G5Y2_9FLAO|nr:penicillin acylase family protein [Sediminicola luteus]PCE64057.1 penicillin acylase family protein [Sediminicola luteus]